MLLRFRLKKDGESGRVRVVYINPFLKMDVINRTIARLENAGWECLGMQKMPPVAKRSA